MEVKVYFYVQSNYYLLLKVCGKYFIFKVDYNNRKKVI